MIRSLSVIVISTAAVIVSGFPFLRPLSQRQLNSVVPPVKSHSHKELEGVISKLDVQVYDNAFSRSACEQIHELAIDHSVRGNDGSSIFFRPPHNESQLSPLESIIHSALACLNDTSKTVEYWSRIEYMNIDTHADIDEVELEDDGTLRCPEVGHVLYLQVDRGLRGPTCVFPKKRIGWCHKNNKDKEFVDLITVPPVQGRILRFPGSALHAVPRPAHRWLLPQEEEEALRLNEQQLRWDDSILDEDDEVTSHEDSEIETEREEEECERSVLLFNTWSEPPPRGINRDYATGAVPLGIELDEDGDLLELQEQQRVSEWERNFGKICCNPKSEWLLLPINASGDDSYNHEVRVNLMGKRIRRLYPTKRVRLSGPDGLSQALEEESVVSWLRLADNGV